MRILCLTPWFPPHPQAQVGKFILDSVESVRALGHEVKVLVTPPRRPRLAGHLAAEWRSSPIDREAFHPALGLEVQEYWSIPRNWLRPLSNHLYQQAVVRVLRRILTENTPDLIHAHNELPASAALQAVGVKGPPVVVTLHGVDRHPRMQTASHRRFQCQVLSRVDRAILVGEPLRATFVPLMSDATRLRVVNNGCRLPAGVAPQPRVIGDTMLRLISVSNLVEGKGIDLNLQALARHGAQIVRPWHYTVVGDGNQRRSLERLSVELGLATRVDFVGRCDHEAVYAHLAAADIFVLPSCPEAFGIAYLEAMACGLVAIGIDGQGPASFIRHGETGFLVPPNDVDALAACLIEVAQAGERLGAIAAAGQRHVLGEYSWARHAERLVAVYRELVTA